MRKGQTSDRVLCICIAGFTIKKRARVNMQVNITKAASRSSPLFYF